MQSFRFPRALIGKLEARDLPLQTLEAIRRVRGYLDEVEAVTSVRARRLGASATDIGSAIGLSGQAVYNHLHAIEASPRDDVRSVLPDLTVSAGTDDSSVVVPMGSPSGTFAGP